VFTLIGLAMSKTVIDDVDHTLESADGK